MARKRKVGLPRVTLMAYSRRDLLAFTESVEALRHLVNDLRLVAVELSNAAVALGKTTKARKPSKRVSVESEPPTSATVEGKGVGQ